MHCILLASMVKFLPLQLKRYLKALEVLCENTSILGLFNAADEEDEQQHEEETEKCSRR